MLVDSLRAQENYFWMYLILFLQPIGPLVYFVTHKLPDFQAGRRLHRFILGGRRLRELKAKAYQVDIPYHWTKLGEEYLAGRNWADAATCFEEALKRDPRGEEAHYGLGQARLALGQYQAALDELRPIVEGQPRYNHGEGQLSVARAWKGLGDVEEALAAYRALLQHYTYSEVRYEYAELLYGSGEQEEALALMRRILEDGRIATGFSRAQERRWGRKAGRFLRTHPLTDVVEAVRCGLKNA